MTCSDETNFRKNLMDKLKNNPVLYDIILAVLLFDLKRMRDDYYSYFPDSNHLSNANYVLEELEKYNKSAIINWLIYMKMREYSIQGAHESDDKDGSIKYATCNTVKALMETYEL